MRTDVIKPRDYVLLFIYLMGLLVGMAVGATSCHGQGPPPVPGMESTADSPLAAAAMELPPAPEGLFEAIPVTAKFYRVAVTNGPAPQLFIRAVPAGETVVQMYRWLGADRLTISNRVQVVSAYGGEGELKVICTNAIRILWQSQPEATYTMFVSTNLVDWEDLRQDYTGFTYLNFYDSTDP